MLKKLTDRTTMLGISTILAAVSLAFRAYADGDPATVVDWGSLLPEITAGIGLILARSNNVTSEQAGAK